MEEGLISMTVVHTVGVGRTERHMATGFAPVQKAKVNTPAPGIMDLKYPDHTLGRGELNYMSNIYCLNMSHCALVGETKASRYS